MHLERGQGGVPLVAELAREVLLNLIGGMHLLVFDIS